MSLLRSKEIAVSLEIPFVTFCDDKLLSRLQTWLRGGAVGGATGVVVCFWTRRNFVGDADFRWRDLTHGQIGAQFVGLLRIFTRVVTDDQRDRRALALLHRHAPLGFWSDTRKTTADNAPKVEGMLCSSRSNDSDVLTQVSFAEDQGITANTATTSFITVSFRLG